MPAKKQAQVWIGELGDIRPSEQGPVIGWATVDGSFPGEPIPFKKDSMQKDPTPKIIKCLHTAIANSQKSKERMMKELEKHVAELEQTINSRFDAVISHAQGQINALEAQRIFHGMD